MREKLIAKYPEKSLKYFLSQTLAQKINNLTHYKNLTQQEPKTSTSAVTCSDEIQQKNLKRLLTVTPSTNSFFLQCARTLFMF